MGGVREEGGNKENLRKRERIGESEGGGRVKESEGGGKV